MDKKKNIINVIKFTAAISDIPFISSIISELIAYFDEKKMNERLVDIENKLQEIDFNINMLKDKLNKLSEHEYYVLRNNIKNAIVSAIPEISDSYNQAIIDYIINESNRDMIEEVSEIIAQLNKNDINLLFSLKKFINTVKVQCEKNIQADKVNEFSEKFSDRNFIFGKNTVFIKDFRDFQYECINRKLDVTQLLCNKLEDENGNIKYDFAYESRSLMKLQSLGVVSLDFKTTLGTSSVGNIDRIHITLFGVKIFEYL